MRNIYALLTLGRPLTSFLIALAIFTGSLVGAGSQVIQYPLQVLIGAILGFIFGIACNSMNDYFDQNVDKINHPERPIPSGKISSQVALNFSIIIFGVALGVALFLSIFVGFETLFLVLVALILQVAYEAKIKRKKYLGNIVIGFQTVLAFTFGGVIVKKVTPTILMAIAGFLSIVGREIVKDVEDIEGDTDKVTLPRIIGVKNANLVASLLIISAVATSIIGYYPFTFFGTEYLITVIIADCLFFYSILILFRNPKKARRLMKVAMIVAMIAFIIGGLTSGT
jgi:geranylgeranylglycerol-phosphate geranylgeranyltransferase